MPKNVVIVVGDVMLDELILGEATRISPEAPVPVVTERSTTLQAGGAANVAANIAALGNNVLLFGATGDDSDFERLSTCVAHCAGVRWLFDKALGATTIRKTRIICNGQQLLRIDREDSPSKFVQSSQAVFTSVSAVLHDDSVRVVLLVISDYAKGTLDYAAVSQILDLARQKAIPVMVDTKPANVAWFKGASLLKINLREALETCDAARIVHPALFGIDAVDAASTAAHSIRRMGDFGAVIVTCGSDGAVCCDGSDTWHQPAVRQAVFDVCGAGDTFLAAVVDAYLHGSTLRQAVEVAVSAAACAVSHLGTFVLTRDVLDAMLTKQCGKIVNLELAVRCVWHQRAIGRRVVMTNGKFRLLHHGHLASLQWAKEQGDFLVVAVNSNNSIKALTVGLPEYKQVCLPEATRAQMIAQQACVDLVVVFDDPSVEQTVRAIQPDILVKGAQYRDTHIPGADFVASRGGVVRFAPMVDGVSVTGLLRAKSEET